MKTVFVSISILFFSCLLPDCFVHAGSYSVDTTEKLKSVLAQLQPGDVLEIEKGEYAGGIPVENINGTKELPIVIRGKQKNVPPVFIGGNTTLNFSRCSYLQISNIKIQKAKNNGIHIHDGNSGTKKEKPSVGISIDSLVIEDTGPVGNYDAIKLSGVKSFSVKNCRVSGWGGSAVDIVGCSYGRISRCVFKGKKGFSQGNGVQIKGGSHNILVESSVFLRPGRRGVNLGGQTGYQWFRPDVVRYEARNIEIAGNFFYGGTAIAFVTSQSGFVHHNAILFPDYVIRILQESNDPYFLPCGNGVFSNNIIVVGRNLKNFINIGRGTNPRSFYFSENLWFDDTGRRTPVLPTREHNPTYGVDPMIIIKKGKIEFKSKDPRLHGKGPVFFKSPK